MDHLRSSTRISTQPLDIEYFSICWTFASIRLAGAPLPARRTWPYWFGSSARHASRNCKTFLSPRIRWHG